MLTRFQDESSQKPRAKSKKTWKQPLEQMSSRRNSSTRRNASILTDGFCDAEMYQRLTCPSVFVWPTGNFQLGGYGANPSMS